MLPCRSSIFQVYKTTTPTYQQFRAEAVAEQTSTPSKLSSLDFYKHVDAQNRKRVGYGIDPDQKRVKAIIF